jgi:DNA-binding transcriptional regulator PaaX
MSQYKYYLKKPKAEITKDIFVWLAVGGVVAIAATSPYFSANLITSFPRRNRRDKKKVYDTFSRLRREGYLKVEKRNHQIYISLTQEGKKKAGRFQMNSLEIQKPKRWDRKWRIVLFDIENSKNIKRNALRGKLKELGFYLYQKSVWIYPYKCDDEIKTLKDFFGLEKQEISLIVAEKIANEKEIRKFFKL